MITLAPVMAAPEGSVTCPRSAPLVAGAGGAACAGAADWGGAAVCADDEISKDKNKKTTAMNRMYFSTFTFLAASRNL
jgi:hypothetical protein